MNSEIDIKTFVAKALLWPGEEFTYCIGTPSIVQIHLVKKHWWSKPTAEILITEDTKPKPLPRTIRKARPVVSPPLDELE